MGDRQALSLPKLLYMPQTSPLVLLWCVHAVCLLPLVMVTELLELRQQFEEGRKRLAALKVGVKERMWWRRAIAGGRAAVGVARQDRAGLVMMGVTVVVLMAHLAWRLVPAVAAT